MARKTELMKERLERLFASQSFAEVAKDEGVSRSTIKRYVDNALKERFIKKYRGRFLPGPEWVNEQEESGWIEVHKLMLVFPVENPSKDWLQHSNKMFDGSWYSRHSVSRNYNEVMKQFYHEFHDIPDWQVRTTTRSVILQMKEGWPIRGGSAIELSNRIQELGMKYKSMLQERFLVSLGTEAVTFKVSQQHWVLLNTIIAKRFREEEKSLQVWIDGELRTVVDFSHGVPHLENVHAQHSPMDTAQWQAVVVDVNTGEYAQRKEDLNVLANDMGDMKALARTMLEGQQAFAQNQMAYSENIASHIGAIKTLGRNVDLLTRQVMQFAPRRKKDLVPAPDQSKLDVWFK